MKCYGTARKRQKGYTLLEYSAGAAILLGVVFAGIETLGTSIRGLLTSVAQWADSQQKYVSTSEK